MGRRLRSWAAVVATAGAVALAGCSSSLPKSVTGAPVLSVVTGLWPLAQAATQIGGEKVAVDDIVPPGTNPLIFQPGAADTNVVRSAGLVLLAGGGLQPALARAAQGAPHALSVADSLRTSDPYVWLDPATMERAVQAIADAMAAANPAASSLYQRNAGGVRSEISSLDIDYSSTLTTCPGTTMVTPDTAFSDMASHYGLNDLVAPAGISAATLRSYAARLQGNRAGAAFTQPWVDNAGVRAVSGTAGIRLHTVDTLAGTPTTGIPTQNTYLNRMEEVLGVISGALGCSSNQQ